MLSIHVARGAAIRAPPLVHLQELRMASNDRPEIAEWLRNRGHSSEHIVKILKQLDEFDAEITRESFFDAMETGELDIDAIVKDAIEKQS